MSADEFTKLITYMEERFDRIEKALEKKAEKLDLERILGALDAFAKRQERRRRTSGYGSSASR